jgi:hypothetical protein
LPAFERNAGDLGVKAPGVAYRRIRIAEILVALGEDALDEPACVVVAFRSASVMARPKLIVIARRWASLCAKCEERSLEGSLRRRGRG